MKVARIFLAPGELFEHAHSIESKSEILEGSVVLRRENETLTLKPGDVVITPPNVLERWENKGDVESGMDCCIHCSH
jgi:quercetin dioxygenase-like cupin family protein